MENLIEDYKQKQHNDFLIRTHCYTPDPPPPPPPPKTRRFPLRSKSTRADLSSLLAYEPLTNMRSSAAHWPHRFAPGSRYHGGHEAAECGGGGLVGVSPS